MRILAITDFHGDATALRKAVLKTRQSNVNVIVVCGDVTHFGSLKRAKELLSLLIDASCPVLFVPGNCDPPELAEEEVEMVESIHGRCIQIDSVNFFGVGGSSPSPFDTPFELLELEIANLLEEGFSACQNNFRTVLVSHSPPKNTSVDVTITGEHVGSFSVREFIEKTNPALVLCGHIHEAVGVDKINNCVVVNPGSAKHRRCALIELNERVDVKLARL